MTRFSIDLLHTGRLAESWQDWFAGPRGRARLGLFAGGGVLVLALVYVLGVHLPSRQLAKNQAEISRLKRVLAEKTEDLRVVKADLDALSAEARRQVRWSELLTTFSEQLPPVLRLQKVALVRNAPPPAPVGQPSAAPARAEGVMQIEAETPLRPGGPPLLETAKFMAGVMGDPSVSKRFQLRSWEIRPPTGGGAEGAPMLQISVTLAERVQ